MTQCDVELLLLLLFVEAYRIHFRFNLPCMKLTLSDNRGGS